MKCPKIRFDEAEVIFLNESERADDWYSQVLKRIIERSLGSYYERDLSRELMYAFDPMSAWQIAAYHYRLFQEKVHQEMPGWINRVVEDDAAAALCYRRLCRKHERLCDYREMLAGVGGIKKGNQTDSVRGDRPAGFFECRVVFVPPPFVGKSSD